MIEGGKRCQTFTAVEMADGGVHFLEMMDDDITSSGWGAGSVVDLSFSCLSVGPLVEGCDND